MQTHTTFTTVVNTQRIFNKSFNIIFLGFKSSLKLLPDNMSLHYTKKHLFFFQPSH
ncbi:Uncharacterised protein [Klebsiella variicola]|nr:Uncharacterised protein [Klebsiella variicola]